MRLAGHIERLGDRKDAYRFLILVYDIFVDCNWVDTRWQQYSTHLHTNSAQNNTINTNSTQNNTIDTNSTQNTTINNLTGKSADRAPSLRVIPWHLPYN